MVDLSRFTAEESIDVAAEGAFQGRMVLADVQGWELVVSIGVE